MPGKLLPNKPPSDSAQQELTAIYLANRRQRFKSEINRMTGGAMREMLGDRQHRDDLVFLMSYLHAFHWLQQHVERQYQPLLLAAFRNSPRAFLMELLEHSASGREFVSGYINHWIAAPAESPVQRAQLLRLLAVHRGDSDALINEIMATWTSLGLFTRTDAVAYSEIGRRERDRYGEMLDDADQQRLALVDALPEMDKQTAGFAKLGIIPAMGCPQTCRHCMFIWRPPKSRNRDPQALYKLVDAHTQSVLFTGGDLTRHMDHFYRAIGAMRHIRTFAILLNGDFATTSEETHRVLRSMATAIRKRPGSWPKAQVLLQISFDEFHQEVIADRHGELKERIPVQKIANIVEAAPRYPEIRLALLHKQNGLNFSMDLFQKGVFARLVKQLGERGHQVQILSSAPSSREKSNPAKPGQRGKLIKDASFILKRHPDHPVMLTSSTIDAYGRAELLEVGEAVREREFLADVLRRDASPGEGFDTDLMFWFNGWVTLFSAVHIALGNLHEDDAETIFARHRKDPLLRALRDFDRRLLDYYGEVRNDLDGCIARATGPHHLFHVLTESAEVRLHMTRRLLGTETA
ncbi:MAG: radical SAM protein [Pseudomonadota bacterium]